MGRRSVERERFWREAVAAWRRGGASVRDFCAERELSEASFYCWRRELQRRDAERGSRDGERDSRVAEGDARAGVGRSRLDAGHGGAEREQVRGRGGEGVLSRAIAPVSGGRSVEVPAFVALTVEDVAGDAADDVAVHAVDAVIHVASDAVCSPKVPAFGAAMVDGSASAAADGSSPLLEVQLAGGDRLRVPVGFDAGTLRTVVEALRSRPC